MLKDRNFQGLASSQGSEFHSECIRALLNAGFKIEAQRYRIDAVGIELDAVTTNRDGVLMPWEFKGSWNGTRPGLHRTDTLKKAIANGYMLTRWADHDVYTPLLVMTSHGPWLTDGSCLAMYQATERTIVLDFVDSRDYKRLGWLYRATVDELCELQFSPR